MWYHVVVGSSLMFACVSAAFCAGKPDMSFGEDGFAVLHADYLQPFGEEYANDLAIDRLGRYVVAGDAQATEMTNDVVGLVARTMPDGTPDRTFGGNGFVHLRWQDQPLSFTHVDPAPEAGLVLGGVQNDAFGKATAPVVCKLLESGQYDLAFGVGGCRALDKINGAAGLKDSPIQALLVQENGGVLVLGVPEAINSDARGFAIVRLLPDGRIDTGFGGTDCAAPAPRCGMALSPKPLTTAVDGAGLALDVDKSTILVGGAVNAGSFQLLTAFRYTDLGELDTVFEAVNFDSLTGDPETHHAIRGVHLALDGAVIVTGQLRFGMQEVAGVARFLPDGTRDVGFGADGRATYVFDPQQTRNKAVDSFLQSDGRLLITGWTLGNDTCHVLRVDGTTGKRDLAFGGMGSVSPDSLYGAADECYPFAGAVANDTSVLFVWSSDTDGDSNPTLVKLDRDLLFVDGLEQ